MAITDRKIHSSARLAQKQFRLNRIPDGPLTPVALSINANAAKFDVGAFLYAIAGQIYYHAASTAHTLSAVHATGIAKWLGALLTIDREGTITTHGNPNTGDQDHATEQAALDSLALGQLAGLYPAHSVGIGTITLLTNTLDWDGNTDTFSDADLLAANLLGYKGDRRWMAFQPGFKFRVMNVRPQARSKSGVAFVDVVATNAGMTGVLTPPRLEVDRRAVANTAVTKLRVGGFDYLINGVLYHKDAAKAIAFTAAHVVSLDKWGAVLVQIDDAGAISTKVVGTPQAYADQAAALAALPAPDASKAAIGTIVIEADGSTWTANTDDLVATSDLEALDVLPETQDRLLAGAGLAIDAVAEKFKVGGFTYVIDGVKYTKTAATAIVFTAAHVCALDKFLAILVQINAAGTVSTKVPVVSGRSQTASQGYDSFALAVAALPSVDPDKVALGHIVIEADGTTWTANTDDMTAASDVDAATFVSITPPTNDRYAVEAAVFNVNSTVAATLGPKAAAIGDENGQVLALIGGTTGIVVEPEIDIEYRPLIAGGA